MAYTADDEIIYKALIYLLSDYEHIYNEVWADKWPRYYNLEPAVIAARASLEILKAKRGDPIDEESLISDLKLEQARVFQPDDYRRMVRLKDEEKEARRRRGGRPRKKPEPQEVS